MLNICLQILSILGIGILALLALTIIILLLLLFFPVTYRVSGAKDAEGLRVTVAAKWLFGLVRAGYRYPEPGRVVAKALWFTLYDSEKSSKKETEKSSAEKEGGAKAENNSKAEDGTASEEPAASEKAFEESGTLSEKASGEGEAVPEAAVEAEREQRAKDGADPRESKPKAKGAHGKFSRKFEKIKYTISGIRDKIKDIWDNISYYAKLLQEEETKALFSHVGLRLGKILKNIRPGHIKADILFGTGAPDTTGYVYGGYCMLSAAWREGIRVTPDFDRAVLEARAEARGHITVWVLLINAVKLITDKRLKRFTGKLKAGRKRRRI